jgi:rhodanese-related sulfurtransferase
MSNVDGLSFQHQSLVQQGYQSYTPSELKQLEWGLRFTPSVCSLLTLVGLLLQLPWLLIAVSVLGFLAFFFPAGHPMDLLYNNVVRHAFGAVALPPNPFQRRLACLAAAVMNLIAAVLFMTGLPVAAWVVGGILLVLQLIVITTHFCTLSWMYEGLMRALGRWNVPIESEQAKKLLQAGAELIDVRGPDEYAGGHLPNARNIPLEQIKEHATEFADKTVLLYCYSGMRSHIAAEALHQVGIKTAYNLGGMPQVKKNLFADVANYGETATQQG